MDTDGLYPLSTVQRTPTNGYFATLLSSWWNRRPNGNNNTAILMRAQRQKGHFFYFVSFSLRSYHNSVTNIYRCIIKCYTITHEQCIFHNMHTTANLYISYTITWDIISVLVNCPIR